MIEFTNEQTERYSRHIILNEVGVEGQMKILEGKVLVVGAGGLGSPVLYYLAAAGVGKIGIIDGDVVDRTNLQRQIIHTTPDLGRPKVLSAKEKIDKINPGVKVKTYNFLLTADNAAEIIKDYDFIVDGADNFPTKFLINDACVMGGKAFSHGGILRFSGQALTWVPGSACYRCAFYEPPPKDSVPSCSQAGVLGAVAGILGSIQATEALKYLTGKGQLLTNKIMIFDAFGNDYRTVDLNRREDCPVCGKTPSINTLQAVEQPSCDLKKGKR